MVSTFSIRTSNILMVIILSSCLVNPMCLLYLSLVIKIFVFPDSVLSCLLTHLAMTLMRIVFLVEWRGQEPAWNAFKEKEVTLLLMVK